MNVLYQSAFLKALGWSLLDSFWQMGVLWLVYILLTGNRKKFNSTQKHTLALLSLAGGAFWFLISLISRFYHLVKTETPIASGAADSSLASSVSYLVSVIEPALPFLSIAYLVSIAFLFVRLYRQYSITQRLFSTEIYKARPELRVFLKNIAAQMGIKKDVRIWLSTLVDTPLTIGFWKPVILLPVAAMNQLTLQQAEAIILHELNHIRRNDYFINLLIACMDIVLFFNPFVRVLTRTIKNERENSCDDMVLQFKYDATQYASALLLLERNRSSTSILAINATGRSRKLLLNRIERILNKRSSGPAISQKLIAYILSSVLIAFIGLYNPGKVIVKSIDTVKQDPLAVNTEQVRFVIGRPMGSEVKATSDVNPSKEIVAKNISPTAKDKNIVEETAEQPVVWASEFAPMEATSVESIQPFTSFAGTDAETREFSITETPAPAQHYSSDVHPYVPSSSFTVQFVQDTAFPKKYILTQADIKARESMNTALKALEEIDWQKLEKEMTAAGKKVDIIKLQEHLQKALGDVDWKKVNEDVQSSLIDAENELVKDHSILRTELKKFQQELTQKKVEQQKIYDAIIHERLCEEKAPVKTERKKVVQKKKIVYI